MFYVSVHVASSSMFRVDAPKQSRVKGCAARLRGAAARQGTRTFSKLNEPSDSLIYVTPFKRYA